MRPRPLQPVEVVPVEGLPEIEPGDDLATSSRRRCTAAGVRDGDIVVVTAKIVSKAEGRLVADVDRAAIDRTRRPCGSSRGAATW